MSDHGAPVERTLPLGEEDVAPTLGPFEPGKTIGDFVVRGCIGEGGMGIVLEAYDPNLDRRVAIKVLHNANSDSGAGKRLLREAQVMARLAHPNVAMVHEVGTSEGQVFLVMEHVEGETLAEWLAHGREWREVLTIFVQAAQGLVAAHDADLVHRDFKPSNVLVGADGRVRVTDFGIAQSSLQDAGIGGTPGYMAPEQVSGEQVDARADQFAFAVALRESLFGRKRDNEDRADIAATKDGDAVPAPVIAILDRATAKDPRERFSDMDSLLQSLDRATKTPRSSVRIVAVLATVAASLFLLFYFLPGKQDAFSPCEESTSLIDETWSPAQAETLQASFSKVDRAHALPSAQHVTRVVNDYAAWWRLSRQAACAAGPEERSRRVGCLDQELVGLRAQLAVWTQADTEVVDSAVRSASRFSDVNACSAAPPLANANALPLLEELGRARALQQSGQLQEAQELQEGLRIKALTLADPGALAVMHALLGAIELDAGNTNASRDHYAKAARFSAIIGDDRAMATSLLSQARATVVEGRGKDAQGIVDAAETLILRAKLAGFEARLAGARGAALTESGEDEAALLHLNQALALSRLDAAGKITGDLEVAKNLGRLSTAYTGLGRYQSALDVLSEGVAIESRVLGSTHPTVAASYHDLAVSESRLDMLDEALVHYQQARDIFIQTYGPNHLNIGLVQLSMAALARLNGDAELALRALNEAEFVLDKALPKNHPHFAVLYGVRAALADDDDRCEDAVGDYQAAIDVLAASEVRGQRLARANTSLAICLLTMEQVPKAHALLTEAVEELASPEIPDFMKATTQVAMAQALWLTGKKRQADEFARTALRALDDPQLADQAAYQKLRATLVTLMHKHKTTR